MPLRTPRRRISPRTKRRCRAIKDFLRRTLGSTSQPDLKINSSVAIDVTDLQHKIVGLEKQISEVSKHCQGLGCLETESNTLMLEDEDQTDISVSSIGKVKGTETKIIYKTPDVRYRTFDDSGSAAKITHENQVVKTNSLANMVNTTRPRKKSRKIDNSCSLIDGGQLDLHKHKYHSKYDNFAKSYTISYHNADAPIRTQERKYKHREYGVPLIDKTRADRKRDGLRGKSPEGEYEIRHKRSSKKNSSEIDKDYIAEIVRRQYTPTKLFGLRESGISQFSAPVCRDQDYPVRENIRHGSDLCSCCYDGRKKYRYECENDMSDLRSVCDTRLYSSKKHSGHKHHRRYEVYTNHKNIYNDTDLYDYIPVKETCSPKFKRKVPLEEIVPHDCYREVPPSPRTLRPRLNLKAQYYAEFEDYMMYKKKMARNSPKIRKKCPTGADYLDSNESSTMIEPANENSKYEMVKTRQNERPLHQDAGTMSGLQCPLFNNELTTNITNESTCNRTQDSDACTDKTDKALIEIKNILQTFLQEIKKETSTATCNNSESVNNASHDNAEKSNTANTMPMSNASIHNYGLPQSVPSPFLPGCNNPCCYPLYPMYPMQNAYMLPNPSYTCTSCVNNAKEDIHLKNGNASQATPAPNAKTTTETEKLIKEIYNFVAHTNIPKSKENQSPRSNYNGDNISTCRNTVKHKHDAKVGTNQIKCYSKSCEALGSRMISDSNNTRAYPTYSDTVLERLTLEATTSETDSTVSTKVKKGNTNKLTKVLQSFGIFKKRKDTIQEQSESDSTVEVDINYRPPFQQDLANYLMHGQEYYNRLPSHDPVYSGQPNQYHSGGPRCYPGYPDQARLMHPPPMNNYYHTQNEHGYRSPRPHPSAPPYPNSFEHQPQNPQVPLCLKEVELKTTGTQIEKKRSTFFGKFSKKMQGQNRYNEDDPRNTSTQTAGQIKPNLPFNTGKLNWKALQAKINDLDRPDKMNNFQYNTQRKLGEGDMNMRNAMMKKLFHKKNPFSPKNIIMSTLLGKHRSSFGEAPAVYRPRMFF